MRKQVAMSIFMQTGKIHSNLRRHESGPDTDIDNILNGPTNGTNKAPIQAQTTQNDQVPRQYDLTRSDQRA